MYSWQTIKLFLADKKDTEDFVTKQQEGSNIQDQQKQPVLGVELLFSFSPTGKAGIRTTTQTPVNKKPTGSEVRVLAHRSTHVDNHRIAIPSKKRYALLKGHTYAISCDTSGHCLERRQGTMTDKLTPTTLPEYLLWYEALQREIAWFLCQTMLARLQQGATRDEVLRWLLGRPFALTIPPSITQRAREYFQSAYEEASRQRQRSERRGKGQRERSNKGASFR